jgi:hypothetical protein
MRIRYGQRNPNGVEESNKRQAATSTTCQAFDSCHQSSSAYMAGRDGAIAQTQGLLVVAHWGGVKEGGGCATDVSMAASRPCKLTNKGRAKGGGGVQIRLRQLWGRGGGVDVEEKQGGCFFGEDID